MKNRLNLLLLLSLVFLVVLSFNVSANHRCYDYHGPGGVDPVCPSHVSFNPYEFPDLGDQPYQPELSVLAQGSVNSFNGNLVLKETDLEFGGRGLDFSLTRTYNSNIFQTGAFTNGQGRKYDLKKSKWLGLGWDFNMGRIRPIENPNRVCNPLNVVGTENLVEFPDGSVSRFIEDTEGNYNEKHFILDNMAKVNLYHTTDEPVGYYEVIGRDGTRYIFNHWVMLSDDTQNKCVSAPWSDINSNTGWKGEQHPYSGVYLTKIIDVNGNYITVDYFTQTWRNPNTQDAINRGYNDAAHPVSFGSPFIKKITDTMGREINFYLDNDGPFSQKIRNKLDYVEYENVNGKKVRINYIYSDEEDVSRYANSCGCGGDNLCQEVCDESSLLVRVRYEDEGGNELYPSTKYEYENNGGSNNVFKLTNVDSPDRGISDYTYKDFEFCTNSGNSKWLNSLWKQRLMSYPGDPGLESEYDYFNPSFDCSDWMRSAIVIGPADETGKKVITKTDYFLELDTISSSYTSLDWRSGLEKSVSIHTATGYDTILHRPTGYTAGDWVNSMIKRDTPFYTSQLIGSRNIIEYDDNNNNWYPEKYDYKIPVKQGVLTEIWDDPFKALEPGYVSPGVKKYFVEIKETDKYGHQKKIKNWGEIQDVSKDYTNNDLPNGCPLPSNGNLLCSDLSGTLDVTDSVQDTVITETTYLYELDSYYEGGSSDPFKDKFQSLDKIYEIIVYDSDGTTKLSHIKNTYDLGLPKFYTAGYKGMDNYQNHINSYFSPRKKGILSKVEVWNSNTNNFLKTNFFYDDAGNLVETRDPKEHLSFAFYDIEGINDYAYVNFLPQFNSLNTCNDGIDNDGDGCIDTEQENNDPCNNGYGYEGVTNVYNRGSLGFEKRISSVCDNNAFNKDPACLDSSIVINKCTPPASSPPAVYYGPPGPPPGGNGTDNETFWDDKLHGFLTKSKSTLLDGNSITKRNDYYSTGQIKTETDFGVSGKGPQFIRYIYDDVGRQTQLYLNNDVPGNPTAYTIYDDNYPRTQALYSKRESSKILLVDNDGSFLDNTNILINVLNDMGFIQGKNYDVASNPQDFVIKYDSGDYNVILWSQGTEAVDNIGDTTPIQRLQDHMINGKAVWMMGHNIYLQNLVGTPIANNYLHMGGIVGAGEQVVPSLIEGKNEFSSISFTNLEPSYLSLYDNIIEDSFSKPAFVSDLSGDPLIEDLYNFGLSYSGTHNSLVTNFDLTKLSNDSDKELLVSEVLLWLSKGDVSSGSSLYFIPVISEFDKLGRQTKTKQMDPVDNTDIITESEYNNQGKKLTVSRPHKEGTPTKFTKFEEYDPLSRIKSVAFIDDDGFTKLLPDVKTEYGPNFVIQTNREGISTKIESDAYGRVVKSTQAIGTTEESITTNTYNPLGNLLSVINPENQELTYNYNSLSWLLSKTDPNSGTNINEYGPNGNPSKITYANGKINTFVYDSLNRLIKTRDNLGNSVLYKYITVTGKSLNKVTEIVDQSGTRKIEYDSRGRLIKETLIPNCGCSSGCVDLNNDGKVNLSDNFDTVNTIKNRDFNGDGSINSFDRTCFDALFIEYEGLDVVSPTGMCPTSEERCSTDPRVRTYSYDFSDNIERIDDNDGNFYDYSYDDLGRLTKVEYNGNIISQNYEYNAHSSITGFDLGDGASKVTNAFGYYERDVDLVSFQSSSSVAEGILFRREYLYDDVNNLKEEKPTKTSITPISYIYDKLHRLTSVTDSSDDIYPGITTIEYNYDLIGNRLSKITDGNTDVYNYDSLNSNSKLLSVDNSDGSVSSYDYDLNGNLISELLDNQLIKEFSYDSYNQLTKVDFSDGNCIRYYYNSDSNRVREEDGVNNIITSYDYDSGGRLISELKWHGPVACNAICGNGLVEEGEICDSAAPTDRICRDFSTPQNRYYNQDDPVSCRSDCSGFDVASVCIDGTCGDGILQWPYEQCEWQGNTKIFWSLDMRTTFSTPTAATCSMIHSSWDDALSRGPIGCGAVGTPNECKYEPSFGSFGNTCACNLGGATVYGKECLEDKEDDIVPNVDPLCDPETGTCRLR